MTSTPWRGDDPFKNYKRRFNEATRKLIVERYENGATCAEIAEDLGTAGATINRILHDAGVQLRPAGRRPTSTQRPQRQAT